MKGENTIFAVTLEHLVESRGALGILNPKQVMCMAKNRKSDGWGRRIIFWESGHQIPCKTCNGKGKDEFDKHFSRELTLDVCC